eukprot:GHVN01048661.1.p1 GENE.GHVN01048661.1~~GHVN01048661.1.p1  ORF type:complete len:409 (-),score=120.77 GHVN01048661.1:162-1388(-)
MSDGQSMTNLKVGKEEPIDEADAQPTTGKTQDSSSPPPSVSSYPPEAAPKCAWIVTLLQHTFSGHCSPESIESAFYTHNVNRQQVTTFLTSANVPSPPIATDNSPRCLIFFLITSSSPTPKLQPKSRQRPSCLNPSSSHRPSFQLRCQCIYDHVEPGQVLQQQALNLTESCPTSLTSPTPSSSFLTPPPLYAYFTLERRGGAEVDSGTDLRVPRSLMFGEIRGPLLGALAIAVGNLYTPLLASRRGSRQGEVPVRKKEVLAGVPVRKGGDKKVRTVAVGSDSTEPRGDWAQGEESEEGSDEWGISEDEGNDLSQVVGTIDQPDSVSKVGVRKGDGFEGLMSQMVVSWNERCETHVKDLFKDTSLSLPQGARSSEVSAMGDNLEHQSYIRTGTERYREYHEVSDETTER